MGTHYRGTKAEIRSLNAYITLVRAAESVTARTSPVMAEAGLSVSQFGSLEALLHLGPLCQRELGRKLLKTGGNVTMVVDNLERRGLVRRRRDSGDRRYITVELSAKGRHLIRRVFPRVVAVIVREMGALPPSKQTALRGICRRLGLGTGISRARGGQR